MVINEPNEGKKNINNKKNDNIDENKGDDIKGGIKKNIDEKINKGLLLNGATLFCRT